MAHVVKRPVYGTLSPSVRILPKTSSVQISLEREDLRRSESSCSTTTTSTLECSSQGEEFVRYDDSDDEDAINYVVHKHSHNFVDFFSQRSLGLERISPISVDREYGTRHLLSNELWKERLVDLGTMDKVFCSEWLNDRQVVFGTKCNKLSIYDISTKKFVQIPLQRGSTPLQYLNAGSQGGIHSLAINPSRTLLATGAENTNDVAFYQLPTFDPVAVGEAAHKDWLFDLVWLDDTFVVSGSRDTSMAIWKVDDRAAEPGEKVIVQPLAAKTCKAAEKVRAVAFNKNDKEIAALSLNGFLHLWNAQTFKQTQSQKLPFNTETVCLSFHGERNLYAVGSRSHTTLLDSRTLQPLHKIPAITPSCGIRSLKFRADILSIGTGVGCILFYDLRANKYLQLQETGNDVMLRTSQGWCNNASVHEIFNGRYYPAVYTHSYDSTGTRIFAAGGPLAVGLHGNYAGLWL